jgi:hypothetical protein
MAGSDLLDVIAGRREPFRQPDLLHQGMAPHHDEGIASNVAILTPVIAM